MPFHGQLKAGQGMRVTTGPLTGAAGTVMEVKGASRVVLLITIRQRSVLVEIDRNWITPDEMLHKA